MSLTVGLPGLGTAEEATAIPKRGAQGKILPKARKAWIKLKPKAAAGKNGSMGESEPAWDWMTLEVFSNFNDFMS